MPDGQRRLRLQPQVGQAQRLLDRGAFCGVDDRRVARGSWLTGATWRARSQLTGPLPGVGEHLLHLRQELLQLRGIVRVWAARAAGQREAERGVGHDSTVPAARSASRALALALRAKSRGACGAAWARSVRRHEASRSTVGAVPVRRADLARCCSAQVPYVELEPGPDVQHARHRTTRQGRRSGHRAARPRPVQAGQLRFLTIVHAAHQLTLLEAIEGWFKCDEAVVPRGAVLPAGRVAATRSTSRTPQDFAESSLVGADGGADASWATRCRSRSRTSPAGSPAEGKLKPGDVIVSPSTAQTVDSADTLIDAAAGQAGRDDVRSSASPAAAQPMTVAGGDQAGDDGVPRIGVTPEIDLGRTRSRSRIPIENIGGPSAGLMLDPGHHRQGRAGGPDRRQDHRRYRHHRRERQGRARSAACRRSWSAAKAAGATCFLTPADNCAEAVANPQPGLPLVQVGILDDGADRAGRHPGRQAADRCCPGDRALSGRT